MDRPEIGVMETDWAENRAKINNDVIRRTLGKVLDSLYSTPERDKFRTRPRRAPRPVRWRSTSATGHDGNLSG